ncbi:MAG: FAD-dependent oxidoreductase [Pseudomonadota bacterium]
MTTDSDIIVVGAGLSGLSLAHALLAEGRDVIVLEARDRAGGRVLSEKGYDLGPAWIWPHNHRMLSLAENLHLKVFRQHSAGRLVFENAQGAVRRDLDYATMGGALRVDGGLARITDALAQRLGSMLRFNQKVTQIGEDSSGVVITCGDTAFRAQKVALALPPRLAVGLGVNAPDVPTWMAGHAKVVAVYDAPFWRHAGLSGDAMSHKGPLAEIHDASPLDASEGALFGFAVPGAARHSDFREQAVAQLAGLFGPEAATPRDVLIKDWSADPATATPADLSPLRAHPQYAPIHLSERLIFAGTETAKTEGGFLEGALEAAAAAHHELTRVMA